MSKRYCWNRVGFTAVIRAGSSIILAGVLAAPPCDAQSAGQTEPAVELVSSQGVASPASPGVFRFNLDPPAAAPLTVYYLIGGIARNGIDYDALPGSATVPAGASSVTITITPIYSGQITNPLTVDLALVTSPTSPGDYSVLCPNGTYPPHADVVIEPPPSGTAGTLTVRSTVVYAGRVYSDQAYHAPATFNLYAQATEPNGTITNVDFYYQSTRLGTGEPVVLDPPGVGGIVGPAYHYLWTDVAAGRYDSIYAVATDSRGVSGRSGGNVVTVLPDPRAPVSVRITSPFDHAHFTDLIRLPIYAYAHASTGAVTSVEFLADGNAIGLGRALTAGSGIYYSVVWTNPAVGNYVLTAIATGTSGVMATSPPVNVTIDPGPIPPPQFSLVSILATDPVAIEGTNCWDWCGPTNGMGSWNSWPPTPARWFTNSGPKNALFTVRRAGGTNSTLNLPYSVGGTASNGIDYLALPGVITIPAGQSAEFIPIVPIDDGHTNARKTVVLTLLPSTNLPPEYAIGKKSAAALIIEPHVCRQESRMMPDKTFHLGTAGPDGAWFAVQCSTDLVHWISICTNQVVNGNIDFIDPDAPAIPTRFYRAAPQNGP